MNKYNESVKLLTEILIARNTIGNNLDRLKKLLTVAEIDGHPPCDDDVASLMYGNVVRATGCKIEKENHVKSAYVISDDLKLYLHEEPEHAPSKLLGLLCSEVGTKYLKD